MRPTQSGKLKNRKKHNDVGRTGYKVQPAGVTRAFVLVPQIKSGTRIPDNRLSSHPPNSTHSPEENLDEAIRLAEAIDLEVCQKGLVPVSKPRPSTLFGSGKVEEIKGIIKAENIELVIVDHALSPIQQRNLETAWGAKILDRTGLILEIFGKRARTREGRLQVELAHLVYQKSRLVRSWTHLERQRGGFGFLGGPGETQIEADRRQIQTRIEAIRKELTTVTQTRELHRLGRRKVPYPIIALVGYTNAGKSTLFNKLTGAKVHAEDQLFATLDPTMREVALPSGGQVILSDTVGFISDLPTTLIAAFRATLEEVIEADIILHVRDIAHKSSEAQRADVIHILEELEIDTTTSDSDIIEIWNKLDLLGEDEKQEALNSAKRTDDKAVAVSAVTGEGIENLLHQLESIIGQSHHCLKIEVPPSEGALLNWIYENAEIMDRQDCETGYTIMKIRINGQKRGQMERMADCPISEC